MRINIGIFSVVLFLAMGCAGIRHLPEQISGNYYGYLPCANCPGIYYELHLYPDRTYKEIVMYDGVSEDPIITENRYRITRDSVVVLRGRDQEEGMSQFAIRNGQLEMLSADGERIETGFPERYILSEEKFEPVFEEITVTGFRATGNEPFWSLEIEFDNIIKFNTLAAEDFEFTANYPEPEVYGDLSVVEYQAKAYNGEFQVTINREECMDTMSGEVFPYSVFVAARRSHRESFRKFEGCGEYIGSYRLNDIWILEKINDEPVDFPDSGKHPTLRVDLAGERISGHGGCNQFNGNAELVNNRLVTGQIVSTRMACPDVQSTENRYLETLSEKTLDFSLENSTLILGDGITKLTFRRAD